MSYPGRIIQGVICGLGALWEMAGGNKKYVSQMQDKMSGAKEKAKIGLTHAAVVWS